MNGIIIAGATREWRTCVLAFADIQIVDYVDRYTSSFPRRRESITGCFGVKQGCRNISAQVMDSRIRGNDEGLLLRVNHLNVNAV